MDDPFRYTKAVVCQIADTLPAAALRLCESSEPVDLQKAKQQHQQYVDTLKTLVGDVIEMPANDLYPDCVFVEDPVVVCGDTALITIPGHSNRRGETVAMKRVMEGLGLTVVDMVNPATMDGGDVLFTGKEFFVGISTRTNKAGAAQLGKAFPNYPVVTIPVEEGLHLKSFCSMAGKDLIAIGSSPAAERAKQLMITEGNFQYQFWPVPDDIGANCLFINGTLVRASHNVFPESSVQYEKLNCQQVPLSCSELNKVDGCFTCCSVLIQ